MIIGIDFDGTCVTHEFPNVGKEIGAIPVLKKIIDNNHKIILHTMRSHKRIGAVNPNEPLDDIHEYDLPSDVLQDAIDWFSNNGIELYGINANPEQYMWTNSPKPYCNMYIDDAALGVPLTVDITISDRPFVDWKTVEYLLKQHNII